MNDTTARRIRSGLVKVRLHTGMAGPLASLDATDVHDVSLRGMGLKLPCPLAAEQELGIELAHPILEQAVALKGRVVWCRMVAGDPYPNAGLELVSTNEEQRLALRLIQAAEVSCRVITDDVTVGFVLTTAEAAWALYDARTVKMATLTRGEDGFEVTLLGARPEESVHTIEAESLAEAVALALGLPMTPLIVPPEGGRWTPVQLQPPPVEEAAPSTEPSSSWAAASQAGGAALDAAAAGSTSRAFHAILASGYHVGYVAVTSVEDVWTLYDDNWAEVAMVAPHDGRFKVSFMGGNPDESLDYLIAKTFTGAVALAFDLKVDPDIDPPLGADADPGEAAASTPDAEANEVEVSSDDLEAPLGLGRDHHCVLDASGEVMGYVARTRGVEGAWSIYNMMREKIAMCVPDGRRVRVVFLGEDPDDSLEYMVARSFLGALALAFELDALPELDPPI